MPSPISTYLAREPWHRVSIPNRPQYVRIYGTRIVHTVLIDVGGTVISACGRRFPPNGRNDVSTRPERWYGEGLAWRECKTCARRLHHATP